MSAHSMMVVELRREVKRLEARINVLEDKLKELRDVAERETK